MCWSIYRRWWSRWLVWCAFSCGTVAAVSCLFVSLFHLFRCCWGHRFHPTPMSSWILLNNIQIKNKRRHTTDTTTWHDDPWKKQRTEPKNKCIKNQATVRVSSHQEKEEPCILTWWTRYLHTPYATREISGTGLGVIHKYYPQILENFFRTLPAAAAQRQLIHYDRVLITLNILKRNCTWKNSPGLLLHTFTKSCRSHSAVELGILFIIVLIPTIPSCWRIRQAQLLQSRYGLCHLWQPISQPSWFQMMYLYTCLDSYLSRRDLFPAHRIAIITLHEPPWGTIHALIPVWSASRIIISGKN